MPTDPVSVATLALSFLVKTTEALNSLRERSQRSKDIDIKDQINTMYDNVLQLKEVILRLLDENRELERKLDEQQHPPEAPKIKQVGETNYYFKGDEGPFCQPCYDVDPKAERLVALSPQQQSQGGTVFRTCRVCNNIFYEQVKNEPPTTNHAANLDVIPNFGKPFLR
jgi:hypothetical protein